MSLENLKNKRKYLRKLVTQKVSQRSEFSNLPSPEISELSDLLISYLNDLSQLDNDIQSEVEVIDEAEFKTCQDYKDRLTCTVSYLRTLLTPINPIPNNDSANARSILRSPVAPLPKYSSEEK